MIEVERSAVGTPPALETPRVGEAQAEAAQFFKMDSAEISQRLWSFDDELIYDKSVVDSLQQLFAGRCAFCGQTLADGKLVVHRFRPPQEATDADGSSSRPHYYWLAYNWWNLYAACAACDLAKGPKFPVAAKRAELEAGRDRLGKERALLIDPCSEDPEQSLVYLQTGEVGTLDQRGKTTIETFDLNRHPLVDARSAEIRSVKAELKQLQDLLDWDENQELLDALSGLFDRRRPFAAVRRQFGNQWVQFRPRRVEEATLAATGETAFLRTLVEGLPRITNQRMEEAGAFLYGLPPPPLTDGVRVSQPKPRRVAPTVSQAVHSGWVDGLSLRNFRVFRSLEMQAAAGPGSWTMLLGENGTGKSSILQAVALALGGPRLPGSLRLSAKDFLRQGESEGSVRLYIRGQRSPIVVALKGDGSITYAGPESRMAVVGFGASRQSRPRSRGGPATLRRGADVANLFDPFRPIRNPESWLASLDEEDFARAARALGRVLMLSQDQGLVRTESTLQLRDGKRIVPLSVLSEGYRSITGLTLDAMRVLGEAWESFEAAEGVALVDELGVHLHPRWQMRITSALREAFPRVQFLTSTHDPLCLRGLRAGEVVVLRRAPDGEVFSLTDLPPVEGMQVDEILMSEYFGLDSTADPDFEAAFARYYDLKAKHGVLSPAEQTELTDLEVSVGERRTLGRTPPERLMFEALRDYVDANRQVASELEHLQLREATRRRIAEIWSETGGDA